MGYALNDYVASLWFIRMALHRAEDNRPYSDSDHQTLQRDLVRLLVAEGLLPMS